MTQLVLCIPFVQACKKWDCNEMLEMVKSGFNHILEMNDKEIDWITQHMNQGCVEILNTAGMLKKLQG